jgi:hypothetical protein
MNARYRHLINVLSMGVVVMFLSLAALFWARWYCHLVRVSALNNGVRRVQITPTGLFPFEKQGDPNLASPSSATAELHGIAGLFTGLGATQYITSNVPAGVDSNVYVWQTGNDGLQFYCYFDPSRGLVAYSGESAVRDPNGTVHRSYVTLFAGPEGTGQSPEERLGRFVSPISDCYYNNNPLILYDKGHRRFFAIHWRDGLVQKGPELPQAEGYQPVQMGVLQKSPLSMSVAERDPLYAQPGGSALIPGTSRQALHAQLPQMDSFPVFVLNESGRIDLLNSDTLALTPDVGRLPTPFTLFRNPRPVGPEDVASYCVYPLCAYQRQAQKKWAYAGCIAATASRDLTGMQVAVFDPNGHSVGVQAAYPGPEAMYFSLPGASLVTVIQYVLENLHPLATLVLSSLTAPQIPARSTWQSIVLLPDSFGAMAARDSDLEGVNRFASSLLFMLPAIGLGVFLAWRASRDGVRMGLSKRASTLWILGIFALGLPAYVTYRLTRPRVALVTCRNCGQGRRADFEKCQRCGAPWVVPELIPPAWRVIGRPEEQPCNDVSPRPEETISNT